MIMTGIGDKTVFSVISGIQEISILKFKCNIWYSSMGNHFIHLCIGKAYDYFFRKGVLSWTYYNRPWIIP